MITFVALKVNIFVFDVDENFTIKVVIFGALLHLVSGDERNSNVWFCVFKNGLVRLSSLYLNTLKLNLLNFQGIQLA